MNEDKSHAFPPEVVLLCGLPGSGKTTYAKNLEGHGYKKLSIDEAMFEKYGRDCIRFSNEQYEKYEDIIFAEQKEQLAALLSRGTPVILDYGFWKRKDRDVYKKHIQKSGGAWRLIYLKTPNELLQQRIHERNKRSDANAMFISDSLLDDFISRFEEPENEGEEIALQTPAHRQ